MELWGWDSGIFVNGKEEKLERSPLYWPFSHVPHTRSHTQLCMVRRLFNQNVPRARIRNAQEFRQQGRATQIKSLYEGSPWPGSVPLEVCAVGTCPVEDFSLLL